MVQVFYVLYIRCLGEEMGKKVRKIKTLPLCCIYQADKWHDVNYKTCQSYQRPPWWSLPSLWIANLLMHRRKQWVNSENQGFSARSRLQSVCSQVCVQPSRQVSASQLMSLRLSGLQFQHILRQTHKLACMNSLSHTNIHSPLPLHHPLALFRRSGGEPTVEALQ